MWGLLEPGDIWRAEMITKPIYLRDHPLMRYHGVPSWPPKWAKTGGGRYEVAPNTLSGEIGILDRVVLSKVDPFTRCYLLIDFSDDEYIGTLLLEDPGFCRQMFHLLQQHLGEPIEKIGRLDLSYLL